MKLKPTIKEILANIKVKTIAINDGQFMTLTHPKWLSDEVLKKKVIRFGFSSPDLDELTVWIDEPYYNGRKKEI